MSVCAFVCKREHTCKLYAVYTRFYVCDQVIVKCVNSASINQYYQTLYKPAHVYDIVHTISVPGAYEPPTALRAAHKLLSVHIPGVYLHRAQQGVIGHLGTMHRNCPMSDRYFKLCLDTCTLAAQSCAYNYGWFVCDFGTK